MTRPTADELQAYANKTIPDVIAPNPQVLFCGINPGLYSAYTGHHFARPGNRFWPALYASGFTPNLFTPDQDVTLPQLGLGITNVVARASAGAAELTAEEFRQGGDALRKRVLKYQPQWLAVVGLQAYRAAFHEPTAAIGPQTTMLGGTHIWVLPNPSGLNAHYTPVRLAEVFTELRQACQ